jgi:integrase
MDIQTVLRTNRPNVTESSIKTYTSIVSKLCKRLDLEFSPLVFIDNKSKVMNYLKDVPISTQRSVISAIIAIHPDENFQELLDRANQDYNASKATGKKTEKEEQNWVSQDEIADKLKELRRLYESVSSKKSQLTSKDYQVLQNYVILALTSGYYIPPRRLSDFTNLKINNINPESDNYIKDYNILILNVYKTSKKYGEQEVSLPKKLVKIIDKFIEQTKHIDREYLLFDNYFNPLTSVKLNQRLNSIFDGKKISTNNFRHSYLTENFGDNYNSLKDTAQMMGTSVGVIQNHYIKSSYL